MNEVFMPMQVSASALEAQKTRLNVIASNIANASSTKTPEGGPYKRKDVLFQTVMYGENAAGVEAPQVVEDKSPFRTVYDPNHPDADKNGYVSYPNINVLTEMVNLMTAQRSYEANLTMITSYKDMYMRTLDILKV
ncbi:MAG TPA: flagellar basal body rod protein FlgC [Dissulfurispiraceae bacterium]|nr:flagellar basal body rod protein FlgC [Dissulfurispiraceae bacterium]